MDETKHAIRREMRRMRKELPDRHHRSEQIWAAVVPACRDFATRVRTPGPLRVLAFVGVGSEPDTGGLIDALHAAGFSVLLPRVEGDEMVAVGHGPGRDLVPGAFGIPEPAGTAVDPVVIDVVIVPGLAFTVDGSRLGQGGGFYDRFLPTVRGACLTIGVCFSEQIRDDLPSEEHDRKVDLVITDAVQE